MLFERDYKDYKDREDREDRSDRDDRRENNFLSKDEKNNNKNLKLEIATIIIAITIYI